MEIQQPLSSLLQRQTQASLKPHSYVLFAGLEWVLVCASLLISLIAITTHSWLFSVEIFPGVSFSAAATLSVSFLGLFNIFLNARMRPRMHVSFYPVLALLTLSGVSLTTSPSIWGFQHLASLCAFVTVAISFSRLDTNLQRWLYSALNKYALGIPLIAGTLVLTFHLFDMPIPAERSVAISLLPALVWASARSVGSSSHLITSLLVWGAIFSTNSRLATVVGAIVLIFQPLVGRSTWPIKVLQFIGRLGLMAGTYLFLSFNNERWAARWVSGDNGIRLNPPATSVSEIVVNSNGRTAVWDHLFSTWINSEGSISGMGTGFSALASRAYSPHFEQSLNEYIRFLVDLGPFGLAMLVGSLVALFFAILRGYSQYDSVVVRWGLSAILSIALMSVAEPSLLYVFFFVPCAVLIGVALSKANPPPTTASTKGLDSAFL